MGRVKELAMQLRIDTDPLLPKFAQDMPWNNEDVVETVTTNILCPNCTIEFLAPTNKKTELECGCCGHSFNLIDNEVNFK